MCDIPCKSNFMGAGQSEYKRDEDECPEVCPICSWGKCFPSSLPVLETQISYSKKESGSELIPRFVIDAHGSIYKGNTCIPPNMSIHTWGSWGKSLYETISKKLLELKVKHKLTPETLKMIYKDAVREHRRFTTRYFKYILEQGKHNVGILPSWNHRKFPPNPGESYYKLGSEPLITNNTDCYDIKLFSAGENDPDGKAIINDITVPDEPDIICQTGTWRSKSLTDVLNWIYDFSNKKYGEYKSINKDDKIIGRIRVDVLTCLNYNYEDNCLSTIVSPSIYDNLAPQMSVDELKKIRQTIYLYTPPEDADLINMDHWQIDETSTHFQYFKKLKEFVQTENDETTLKDIYFFISENMYRSFLGTEILKFIDNQTIDGSIQLTKPLANAVSVMQMVQQDWDSDSRQTPLQEALWIVERLNKGKEKFSISWIHEFLLRKIIFDKLIKLEKNVEDLINQEKDFLNLWLNFTYTPLVIKSLGGPPEIDWILDQNKIGTITNVKKKRGFLRKKFARLDTVYNMAYERLQTFVDNLKKWRSRVQIEFKNDIIMNLIGLNLNAELLYNRYINGLHGLPQHLQTMFRQEFVKFDSNTPWRYEFILFMFTFTDDLDRWHSMEKRFSA